MSWKNAGGSRPQHSQQVLRARRIGSALAAAIRGQIPLFRPHHPEKAVTIVSATNPPMSRHWAASVFGGGILAGGIDLTYACSYHGLVNGIPPIRILQSIASGFFGLDSFQMGVTSAAIGFVTHFFILIVAAAMFYAASRRLVFLRQHAYLSGMAFGVAIYCTMNYIVLPLSAVPHFKSTPIGAFSDFAVHVLLLGPAIALVARHFDRAAAR
jgi:hypothetical protein